MLQFDSYSSSDSDEEEAGSTPRQLQALAFLSGCISRSGHVIRANTFCSNDNQQFVRFNRYCYQIHICRDASQCQFICIHMNFRLNKTQYEFSAMKYEFSAPLSIRLVVAFVYYIYVVIYTCCPYHVINHHGVQAYTCDLRGLSLIIGE